MFDLDHIPDESVLSRTWHKRFDGGVRGFVQIVAHLVVKEAHDRYFSAPSVRPKSEVVDKKLMLSSTAKQLVENSLTSKSIGRPDSLVTTVSRGSTRKIGNQRVY